MKKKKKFGKLIKKQRIDLEKSIADMSKISGVSTCYLSLIENDRRKLFNTNLLKKISKAYKIDMKELVEVFIEDEKQ